MARFRFKYQTVLQHRQNIENQRKRELAEVTRRKVALMDELRNMQETIRQSKSAMSDGLQGRVDLEQIGNFSRYSHQVVARGQQIVVAIAQLDREVEAARLRLAESAKQRKAMELLRDKQKQAWIEEQNRRETLELDEVASQRFARQAMEEATR